MSRARIFESRCLGLGFEKKCKSRSRILNEGLGVSASLGFYHSIPLDGTKHQQHECILVIRPITSIIVACEQAHLWVTPASDLRATIIEDQITETRSLGIKCVSLLEIIFLELTESAFEIVFFSAERVMEKKFSELLSLRSQISNFRCNLIGLSYSCGFQCGSEKNTEIVAGLLSRGFAPRVTRLRRSLSRLCRARV